MGPINPAPDIVSAFLWPSEEYFERGQKLGQFDAQQDYRSYIRQVAAAVFLASDEFDQWTLRYFEWGREEGKELEEIEQQESSILTQIGTLKRESKSLKIRKKELAREH